MDKFTYFGSSFSCTENDINTWLAQAWRAVDRLLVVSKSDLFDKIKRNFFKAAVVSILLYRCTKWTLTRRLHKNLGGNSTRKLRAILNKSWKQHPTKQQLYGYLPPISKPIQIRRTRRMWHCWRSKDELISNVFLWTLHTLRVSFGRLTRTYQEQLCTDTGCSLEDLPEATDDRDEWRGESGKSILAARHDDDYDKNNYSQLDRDRMLSPTKT